MERTLDVFLLLEVFLEVLFLYKSLWMYSDFFKTSVKSFIYGMLSEGLQCIKVLKFRLFQSPLKNREHKLKEGKVSKN